MKVSKNHSQCYNNFKFDGLKIKNNKGVIRMKSSYTDSLAPKFRRKEIYGTLRREIGMILRELCKRKDVEVINAEACPDHIHMYVYHHLWDT